MFEYSENNINLINISTIANNNETQDKIIIKAVYNLKINLSYQ